MKKYLARITKKTDKQLNTKTDMNTIQTTEIAKEKLNTRDLNVQLEAIQELKTLGTQAAIEAIESKLINYDLAPTKFQAEALKALLELNARDSIEKALKNGVGLAIETLSKIGDTRATETIAKEIYGQYCNLAVLGLAEINSDRAIDFLSEAVLNQYPFIAISALTACLNLSEKKAIQVITLALKHEIKKFV